MSDHPTLSGLTFGEVDELFVITSKMPVKRRRFVFNYLKQEKENGTQAAIDSGFSPKSAAQEAARLLRDVKVRRALDIAKKRSLDKCGMSLDELLYEIACIAKVSAENMQDKDGRIKKLADMSPETARAVAAGFEAEIVDGRPLKFKFSGKIPAMEMMCRKFGLFIDKHLVAGAATLEELVAGAGEAGK